MTYITKDDLFLGRSRLGQGQRPVLVRHLRTLLLRLIQVNEGSVVEGMKHICLEEMDLLYMTPFCPHAPHFTRRYGIDIYAQELGKRYGKVGSLWWDDAAGEVEVVSLKRGRWIERLHTMYEEIVVETVEPFRLPMKKGDG